MTKRSLNEQCLKSCFLKIIVKFKASNCDAEDCNHIVGTEEGRISVVFTSLLPSS